jgi:hypothetical protein
MLLEMAQITMGLTAFLVSLLDLPVLPNLGQHVIVTGRYLIDMPEMPEGIIIQFMR